MCADCRLSQGNWMKAKEPGKRYDIAAGLPLTWVATQKEDFQKYLLQNECMILHSAIKNIMWSLQELIFTHRIAAAFYRLQDFKGINMLVDIGNGTMNIMYINNPRPLEKKMLYREIWNQFSVCFCSQGIFVGKKTGNSGG